MPATISICDNLPPLVAAVPGLAEASIGHELTADALVDRLCRGGARLQGGVGRLSAGGLARGRHGAKAI